MPTRTPSRRNARHLNRAIRSIKRLGTMELGTLVLHLGQ